jgi:hypothetical protein
VIVKYFKNIFEGDNRMKPIEKEKTEKNIEISKEGIMVK